MTPAPALIAFTLASGAAVPAWAQTTMTLGEVLVMTPAAAGAGAPAQGHLFQADRGSRKGQLLIVTVPAAGAAAAVAGQASEYHLLHPETAGAPPDVDVLGIHYLKVQPDRREAFEQYIGATVHPAVASLRPDLRLLYYKAVRGPEAGGYILIFALTRASRDRYWPGGADSDDLRAAFRPVQPLTKELGRYFVEGSALTDPKFAAAVFESRDWTDFVLLPSR